MNRISYLILSICFVLNFPFYLTPHSLKAQDCLDQALVPEFNPILISQYVMGATSVYSADIDGDNDKDIIVNSYWDDELFWFENDGKGNFQEFEVSDSAKRISSVFAFDIDWDGDKDILSASDADNKIVWYENQKINDSIVFTEKVISSNARGAWSVSAADINMDGQMDVISASRLDNKIAWYKNDGNENFTEYIISDSAIGARDMHLADFDNDGDFDIVVASLTAGKIIWFENDGKENFQEFIISDSVTNPRSIYSADFNGDGLKDIAAAIEGDGSFSNKGKIIWFKNLGNGQFIEITLVDELDQPRSIYVADMEGDGDKDIIFVSSDDDVIAWLINRGDGIFKRKEIPHSTNDPWAVYAVDIDGDQKMDIVSASFYELIWHKNITLSYSSERIVSDSAYNASKLFVSDFDGDNDLDFAFTRNYSLYLMENNGSNQFTESFIAGNLFLPQSVTGKDLDNDGASEIIVTTAGGGNEVDIFTYDGNNGFTQSSLPTSHGFSSRNAFGIDLDKDGYQDVIAGFRNRIAWYKGSSSGQFTETFISSSNSANAMDVADFDGDGDNDLVVGDYDYIGWYQNNGNSTFTFYQLVSIPTNNSGYVAAADVDNDGDQDFYYYEPSSDQLGWYENDGTGQFTSTFIMNIDYLTSLSAIDMDQDGYKDLIYNDLGSKTTWLKNDSTNFTEQIIALKRHSTIQALDLNQDGLADLAGTSYDRGTVSYFLNRGEGINDFDGDGLADDLDNCPFQSNNSLNFDGIDDYVSFSNPTGIPIGNSKYTIEAWFFANSMGDHGIIGWGPYFSNNQVTALRLSNNGFRHYWWGNDLDANTGNITGQWHHVAATFDGTTRKIYLDGLIVASDQPTGHNVPNANNLTIGKTYGSEYFDGKIDEVRIWNVARTQGQILNNRKEEIAGNESGLVAYYRFNEGFPGDDNQSQIMAQDQSVNANPGMLENFTLSDCQSNWDIGAPVQFLDLDNNGIGDLCEQLIPIEEQEIQDHFNLINLFPNPGSELVNIHFQLPKNERVNLEIYDMIGRLVFEKSAQGQFGVNHIQVDINSISQGSYFLRLSRSNGQHKIKKLIKQ